jgi:hypothetical protein
MHLNRAREGRHGLPKRTKTHPNTLCIRRNDAPATHNSHAAQKRRREIIGVLHRENGATALRLAAKKEAIAQDRPRNTENCAAITKRALTVRKPRVRATENSIISRRPVQTDVCGIDRDRVQFDGSSQKEGKRR